MVPCPASAVSAEHHGAPGEDVAVEVEGSFYGKGGIFNVAFDLSFFWVTADDGIGTGGDHAVPAYQGKAAVLGRSWVDG